MGFGLFLMDSKEININKLDGRKKINLTKIDKIFKVCFCYFYGHVLLCNPLQSTCAGLVGLVRLAITATKEDHC